MSKVKSPKMPGTLQEWKDAFAEALILLHQDSGLSTPDLHEVLDSVEEGVDRIRQSEMLIDDSDLDN
jgi:hypothetical protein